MKLIRNALAGIFILASGSANAGLKPLNVAFFDYSKGEIGTKSFKAMRDKNFEHPCWRKFVEIDGLESVQFDKFPKALERTKLIEAVHGSTASANEFARALSTAGFNGAYAFVPDTTGNYLTVYGISYQNGAISAGASIRKPASGLIDKEVLSKALCEASRALD